MVNRNPVYHQFVFGVLVISAAIRVAHLLNWSVVRDRIPNDKKHDVASMFITGALTFTAGFGIWNVDNIFCGVLTTWKKSVGWPVAFLLEGHSWWHILTVRILCFIKLGLDFVPGRA